MSYQEREADRYKKLIKSNESEVSFAVCVLERRVFLGRPSLRQSSRTSTAFSQCRATGRGNVQGKDGEWSEIVRRFVWWISSFSHEKRARKDGGT